MKKFMFAALAAGLTLSATAPAVAKEVTITVSLTGLDLDDPRDVVELHQRIGVAVENACVASPESRMSPFEASRARENCIAEGTRKAMGKLEGEAAEMVKTLG